MTAVRDAVRDVARLHAARPRSLSVRPTAPSACHVIRRADSPLVTWSGVSSDTREPVEYIRQLLLRVSDPSIGDSERSLLREEIVERHLGLAEQLARRFRNRGEPMDDLVQVARMGLLKAVDGFDPERGVEFGGYAVPTIVGEIKRHFRDKGWSVRVPRRLKDLKLEVSNASATLVQDLGRMPTNADLADYLKVTEAEVRECAVSSAAYSSMSLSAPLGEAAGDATLADMIGGPDRAIGTVDDRETLRPLIEALPSRERRIIVMRFYDNLTQSQIAARIGISQMHVSRLLKRSLAAMREGLLLEC